MITACISVVITLLAGATASAATLAGETYEITWYSIDAGGGPVTGAVYRLDATIGQPDAAPPMSGGPFTLAGGYWGTGCVADVNGDLVVDVDDLVAVILAWGDCPAPPTACPEDIDGDGTVAVDDLIEVIVGWGPC